MKAPKRLAIVFCLSFALIALSLPGCSQNAQRTTSSAALAPPSQGDLQKIIDDAAEWTNRVSTYKFDLNLNASLSVNTSQVVGATSSRITTKATVFTAIQSETDRVARLSHAKFRLSTTIEGRTQNTENSVQMFHAPPYFVYAKLTTQWTKQPTAKMRWHPG